MKKFECKKCGFCCKNFNERDSGLFIFEWERDKILNLAKEKNLIIPFRVMDWLSDSKNNINLVLTYGILLDKPCPFLKNNKCSIYNHRPFSCRVYPLLNPEDEEQSMVDVSTFCPNVVNPVPKARKMTGREYYQLILESYPKALLYAFEIQYIFNELFVKISKTLVEKGIINIVQKTQMKKNKGLLSFAIKKGLINKEEETKLMEDIIQLKHAKDLELKINKIK